MAAVPVHTGFGEPVEGRLAPRGSVPYGVGLDFVGHTRCLANNETCQGYRVKGEDYCKGHMRAFEKNGWA